MALMLTMACLLGGGDLPAEAGPQPFAAEERVVLVERERAPLDGVPVGSYTSWWMVAAMAAPFVAFAFVAAAIVIL